MAIRVRAAIELPPPRIGKAVGCVAAGAEPTPEEVGDDAAVAVVAALAGR